MRTPGGRSPGVHFFLRAPTGALVVGSLTTSNEGIEHGLGLRPSAAQKLQFTSLTRRRSRPSGQSPLGGGSLSVPAARHPLAAGGEDLRQVFLDQAAKATVDCGQEADREEEPGLRFGIALLDDPAGLLAAADDLGDEAVDFAHVPPDVAADLRVVVSLREGLDPEVGDEALLVLGREVAAAHRADPEGRIRLLGDGGLPHRAALGPGSIETREVEVALRGEVTVEDRLRDTRSARDLRRRCAMVGALREDLARSLEERGAPLLGAQPAS